MLYADTQHVDLATLQPPTSSSKGPAKRKSHLTPEPRSHKKKAKPAPRQPSQDSHDDNDDLLDSSLEDGQNDKDGQNDEDVEESPSAVSILDLQSEVCYSNSANELQLTGFQRPIARNPQRPIPSFSPSEMETVPVRQGSASLSRHGDSDDDGSASDALLRPPPPRKCTRPAQLRQQSPRPRPRLPSLTPSGSSSGGQRTQESSKDACDEEDSGEEFAPSPSDSEEDVNKEVTAERRVRRTVCLFATRITYF